MADYDKRYRLESAPEARTDGSGCVSHDIYAEARAQPDGDWFEIPARHKSVNVPGADLSAALATGTNPEKIAAYKALLKVNVNTNPVAVNGWGGAALETLLDANDVASTAATAADTFITDDLGLGYPVWFTI